MPIHEIGSLEDSWSARGPKLINEVVDQGAYVVVEAVERRSAGNDKGNFIGEVRSTIDHQ